MALKYYELADSRDASRSTESMDVVLKFLAMYGDDENTIATGLLLVAPKRRSGLPRVSFKCSPMGGRIWTCEVRYGWNANVADNDPDDDDEPNDETILGPEYSFDISASTVHVTQSKETISKTAAVGMPAAPDYQQAIGVASGSVAGTDIFFPTMEVSITVQRKWIKFPYVRDLRNTACCVNDRRWRGFEKGEVLYKGPSGSIKPGQVGSITHKFSVGKNQTNIKVSPTLTVPSKRAWEYLWCVYKPQGGVNQILETPVYAYVERVYDYANLEAILRRG